MTANSESDGILAAACACTDELRLLLRAEASAIRTYRGAMERGGMAADTLAPRLRDHRDSAHELTARLRSLGGDVSVTADAWDEPAGGAETSTEGLGAAAAWPSLRRGEAENVRRYEAALDGPNLDAPSKELVRSRLLPRQRENAVELEGLFPAR